MSKSLGRESSFLLIIVIAAIALTAWARFSTSTEAAAGTVATGTYAGNSADNRAITGVGFRPDVVMLLNQGSQASVVRTSTMAGDASKVAGDTGTLKTNILQSLDADGFTIGSDARANGNGTAFHWVALKASGTVAVGSYVGNGSAPRAVTGIGFQPDFVITLGNGADSMYRPGTLSTQGSYRLATSSQVSNRIQSMLANGFQVSASADVNASGVTYHYVAFDNGSDVAQGSYSGNGSDNRSITGLGFQPVFALVKRDAGSLAVVRPASLGGDAWLTFDGFSTGGNRIQSLESAGFQVGDNLAVNGSGETYHYLALSGSGAPPPTQTPAPPTTTGTPTFTPTPTPPAGGVLVPSWTDVSTTAGLRPEPLNSLGGNWLDYNNDGWSDFYVGRHGGCDPDLFRNNGDGTFTDVSYVSGQRVCGGDRHTCSVADFNEDLNADMFCDVGVPGNDHVLYNRGDSTFIDANMNNALGFGYDWGRSNNVMDYDGDGDMDFLYGGYNYLSLFRNNGAGANFTRVSTFQDVGNQGARSEAVADFNNDHIPDLFVAMFPHDTGLLWVGNGNGFTDVTVSAGLGGRTGAQAGTFADYDNDGDLDLYVTDYRARTNTRPAILYRNNGNGTFANATGAAGLPTGATSARTGTWGDYNNDGWQDLFVVNGVVSNNGVNQPDLLYLNRRNGSFQQVSIGVLAGPSSGGGGDSAFWADYNHDGNLDIMTLNGSGELGCTQDDQPTCWGPDKLYRNNGTGNKSIQLRLMAPHNTYGYGAKVWLTTPMGSQYQEMTDNMVGRSQNYQVLFFGIGQYNSASIHIRWPDGTQEDYNNIAANTTPLFIRQGTGVVSAPTPAPTPPPSADMIVSNVADPGITSIYQGQSFSGQDRVENVGNVAAPASTVYYYFSSDTEWGPTDRQLIGTRSIPALNPGQGSSGVLTLTVPTDMPSRRSYYLTVCADGTNTVSEHHEWNNCKSHADLLGSGSIRVNSATPTPTPTP